MTLGRLLASVTAFVGIWHLAMNLSRLQFGRAGVVPPVWFFSTLAIHLVAPCVVVLMRERIAGWVLGRSAALRAPLDHRAILAVGSAAIGIHMFLKGLPLVALVWIYADWNPAGWTRALRYPAVFLFTSLLLIVGARFLPMWVGWGRLGADSDRDRSGRRSSVTEES